MDDCLVFAVSYDKEKNTKYYLAESSKQVAEYIASAYGAHDLRSITLLGETFDTRPSTRDAATQENIAVNKYYEKERALRALMEHLQDLATQLEAKVGSPPSISGSIKETETT